MLLDERILVHPCALFLQQSSKEGRADTIKFELNLRTCNIGFKCPLRTSYAVNLKCTREKLLLDEGRKKADHPISYRAPSLS